MPESDFAGVLDKNLTDVVAPKPAPVGNYVLRIGEPTFGQSAQKKTPYVRYPLDILEPSSGVDVEDLAGVDLEKISKNLRTDFWLTEEAVIHLKKFLEKSGVEVEGRTLRAAIPEAAGQLIIGHIKHRPNDRDPEIVYNDVDAWASYEG